MQLGDINLMAQSTRTIKGQIGMLGGRVVKFNTHWSERRSAAGDLAAMTTSCDNLRERMCGLLNKVLEGPEHAELRKKLTDTIMKGKNVKLLDRAIVAGVIDEVEKAVKPEQSLKHDSDELALYSSKNRTTTFAAVQNRKERSMGPDDVPRDYIKTDFKKGELGKDASAKYNLPKSNDFMDSCWFWDELQNRCKGKNIIETLKYGINLYSQCSLVLKNSQIELKGKYLEFLENVKTFLDDVKPRFDGRYDLKDICDSCARFCNQTCAKESPALRGEIKYILMTVKELCREGVVPPLSSTVPFDYKQEELGMGDAAAYRYNHPKKGVIFNLNSVEELLRANGRDKGIRHGFMLALKLFSENALSLKNVNDADRTKYLCALRASADILERYGKDDPSVDDLSLKIKLRNTFIDMLGLEGDEESYHGWEEEYGDIVNLRNDIDRVLEKVYDFYRD